MWFPGGYWAERERAEIPTSQSSRVFRWRKRSGRDSSSRETDSSFQSNSIPQHMKSVADSASQEPPLASPYLTEEAHVLSLQRPSLSARFVSDESRKSPRAGPGRSPVLPASSRAGSGRSVSPYAPSSERLGPQTPLAAEDHQAAVSDGPMSPMSSGPSPLRSLVAPLRKPGRSWLGLISRTREASSFRPLGGVPVIVFTFPSDRMAEVSGDAAPQERDVHGGHHRGSQEAPCSACQSESSRSHLFFVARGGQQEHR